MRITSIYEGTNGIQAADLVGRKLGRDGGATMEMVLDEIRSVVAQLQAVDEPEFQTMGTALGSALAGMEASTAIVLDGWKSGRDVALGASFDYMMQTGYLFGGWALSRSALLARERIAEGSDNGFYPRKIATATFYAEQILPRCDGHAGAVASAGGSLQSYATDWL